MVRDSLKTGIGFGLTSAIITTLGLMVGLHSIETNSKVIIIGGILTIAVADAFSDALGIHISEESKNGDSKHVWESTVSTFFTKLLFALTFLVPIIFLPVSEAVVVSVMWGLLLLVAASFKIAKSKGDKPSRVILEHVIIALVVIAVTHHLGDWISENIV